MTLTFIFFFSLKLQLFYEMVKYFISRLFLRAFIDGRFYTEILFRKHAWEQIRYLRPVFSFRISMILYFLLCESSLHEVLVDYTDSFLGSVIWKSWFEVLTLYLSLNYPFVVFFVTRYQTSSTPNLNVKIIRIISVSSFFQLY